MSDKVTQKTLAFKTFYRFFSGLREKSYLCGGGPVRRVRPVRVMRLGAGSGHGSADGPGEAAGSGRSGEAPCFWNLNKNRKFGQRYEQTSEIGDSGPAGLFDGLLDGEGSPRRDGRACGSDEAPAPDSVERKIPPRIVLMYGVRPPHPVQSVPRQDGGSAAPADSAAVRSGAPVSAVPAESAESVESMAGGR